jgi:hypothetical protein
MRGTRPPGAGLGAVAAGRSTRAYMTADPKLSGANNDGIRKSIARNQPKEETMRRSRRRSSRGRMRRPVVSL